MTKESSFITRQIGGWGDPDVPKHGWECFGVNDMKSLCVICEMCQVMRIRYVHKMRHVSYPNTLNCGCVCAGHMENDQSAARHRERFVKGQIASWMRKVKKHVVVTGWRALGDEKFIQFFGAKRVLIAPFQAGFRAIIYEDNKATIYGKKVFHTPQDAIRAVILYIYPQPKAFFQKESP